MALDTFLLRELVAAIVVFFITRFSIRLLFKNHSRKLPPGPKGWPIVGALPLLGTMPHVALAKMAKQYGPVMYLKMGTCDMAVASTPDAARAFLKTLDINFSNRPPNAGATHLAYDAQDMVFAHYGPRWKLLRKLSNLHMLGGKALDDWAQVRVIELGHMIQAIYESSKQGEPVVVPELLTYAMANMIGQVILSRRVFVTHGEESNEFKDMVVELMTSAGLFNIGDFIPSIAWLDLQGIERGMKKLHKRFDVLLAKMIEEHTASAHERKGKPDFLDIVVANQDNSDGERLNLTNIKALLLNLFTAGTDTSSSIIEWALTEMLKNPSILKRAHDEMDQVIGRNRRLEEADIAKLPYLQAICKETMRKHPSTPLNLPRVSTEACEVNGYYIPKNTRLSVNIWAIGRDPDVWENPLDFTPERFLSGKYAKIDPRGNDFELIPFGAGRRICAGTRMGIVLVEYILGTLVHSFDWKLPNGVVELNMDEAFGLALQKAVPLSAMNLFSAGTDTSSSIIEWALTEMLKNPRILKRAHDEMDQVIGRNRRLEEADIAKLPYLQAICKETMRKHPSTPLNLPRVSTEACEVNGYYIPKNTRLSVNIWAIGRDPDVWENPLDFTPERFLSGKYAKIDPRGNDFELIPFGAGRRICAGTRMGIVLVEYILGTLVHSFDWKLPNGVVELNMDEAFGLALQKAVPLSAMLSPRLSLSAYAF